jgi:hypothetical protein
VDVESSSGMLCRILKECRTVKSNSRLLNNSMAWGKEDQLMPAWSFVIGDGHVVDMPPLVDVEVHQLYTVIIPKLDHERFPLEGPGLSLLNVIIFMIKFDARDLSDTVFLSSR